MSECPYLDGVIIDKRLPRWNLFYLNNLKKLLRYDFSKYLIYKILIEQSFIKNFDQEYRMVFIRNNIRTRSKNK